MPVVFRFEGFRFHFYSDEGNPREPIHIHVANSDADAKFWILPEVRLASNRGLDDRTIRKLQNIVIDRSEEIVEFWNEYFS